MQKPRKNRTNKTQELYNKFISNKLKILNIKETKLKTQAHQLWDKAKCHKKQTNIKRRLQVGPRVSPSWTFHSKKGKHNKKNKNKTY